MKHTIHTFTGLLGITLCIFWCGQVSAGVDQLITEKELRYRQLDFQYLCKGNKTYSEQLHKKLVSDNSKGYIYQITMSSRQDPKKLNEIRTKFAYDMDEFIMNPRNLNNNKAFREAYAGELIKHFKIALKRYPMDRDRVINVNLALMLPTLGKIGDPRVGQYLSELLRTGENDIIKLFAMKGLQKQIAKDIPKVRPFMENKERMEIAERMAPLLKYLTNPPDYLKKGTPAQIGGYQYIRCEAIEALGETQLSCVPLLPGLDGEIHAPVAYWLAKTLAAEKDRISPPPSIEEQIEAAIGLCKMDAQLIPRYNSQLGFYLVGNFLADYTKEFREDQARFDRAQTKTLPNGKEVSVRVPPRISWKLQSARLLVALEELEKNTPPNNKLQQNYASILQSARTLLTSIKSGNQVESEAVLRGHVKAIRPANGLVYEKSQIKIELP